MSALLTGFVWNIPNMPLARKSVLLYLANCANDDGESCYPSQSTIARCTGLSDRCIREHTRELEAAGFVETDREQNGMARRNHYRLNVDRISASAVVPKRNHVPVASGTPDPVPTGTPVPMIRQDQPSDPSDTPSVCGTPEPEVSTQSLFVVEPEQVPGATGNQPRARKARSQRPADALPEPKRTWITDAFVAEMREKYGGSLPDFDARVERCRNHIAHRTAIDKRAHLDAWLRDSKPPQGAQIAHSGSPPRPRGPGLSDFAIPKRGGA